MAGSRGLIFRRVSRWVLFLFGLMHLLITGPKTPWSSVMFCDGDNTSVLRLDVHRGPNVAVVRASGDLSNRWALLRGRGKVSPRAPRC